MIFEESDQAGFINGIFPYMSEEFKRFLFEGTKEPKTSYEFIIFDISDDKERKEIHK